MPDDNGSVGDFTGRVIVVTGANSGIGQAAAIGFARRGATVALVGRDRARLEAALDEVRAVTRPGVGHAAYPVDFAILDQVRDLAARLRDAYPSIDVLANNAGGAFRQRTTTVDGHEHTIQVNHLAPFLLTNLLRDRLSGGRVVNTASEAHRAGTVDATDLDSTNVAFRSLLIYGSSKQANILFTVEAARRWPDVMSFAYHPGIVRTRFGRNSRVMAAFYQVSPFLRSPGQGADTMRWLAGAPGSDLVSGGYYLDRALRQPSSIARNPQVATDLWKASEQAVGLG